MMLLHLLVAVCGAAVILTPDSDPVRLVAHADALTHRVELEHLHAGVTYEVRVSYVATTPCSFAIRLADEHASTGRRLLNAEKLIFRHEHGDRAAVDISADLADYVPAPGAPSNAVRQVPFVVALESTWHGAPLGVVRLVALIVAVGTIVALLAHHCTPPTTASKRA